MSGWAGAIVEKARAGLSGLAARPLRQARDRHLRQESDALLIVSPLMDARFREICAVWSDGRCLVAAGYLMDPRLCRALVGLRDAGVVPARLAETEVPLEEIAAVWRAVAAPVRREELGVEGKIARLFGEAARARASDVILDNDGQACRVYALVNDRKLLLRSLSAAEGREIAQLLFHAKDEGAGQASYQREHCQGFGVRPGGAVPLPETVSGLRCERGPHEPEGDHLYIRLFYTDSLKPGTTLEDLGLTAEQAAVFAEVRQDLRGGVFIGGSTGDGKSTTLAANLALQVREFRGELNMVTLEDPVEYRIAGAVQIPVPTAGTAEERSAHYRRFLMHFCRIHPAAGMVSEIRDAEGARQVLQFIDTGHQVWTTIHVASANSILFRLMDLGVSVAEVAKPGNVALLAKQTLVPLLCPHCARPAPADRELPGWLAGRLGSFPGARFRDPAGCGACRQEARGRLSAAAWTGYAGVRAVMELIRPDEGYLEHVRERDPIGARRYWLEALGGAPVGRSIDALVRAGLADPFDALTKGAELAPPAREGVPRLTSIEGAAD